MRVLESAKVAYGMHAPARTNVTVKTNKQQQQTKNTHNHHKRRISCASSDAVTCPIYPANMIWSVLGWPGSAARRVHRWMGAR